MTSRHEPHSSMLPECDVQFDRISERLEDIKDSLGDARHEVAELRKPIFSLPATILAAVQQHSRDCPAHKRVIQRASNDDSLPPRLGTGRDIDTPPRLPRWMLYLLGGGAGLGAIGTALMRLLDFW